MGQKLPLKLPKYSFLTPRLLRILLHNCFRVRYSVSSKNKTKRKFGARNVHKNLSALNPTIIFIKPFNCNNSIFSVYFLNEISFLH